LKNWPDPGSAPDLSTRLIPHGKSCCSVRWRLSKLLYFIGWAIPLLLLSFVPVINIAAPILWVLFALGCWRWNMPIIPWVSGDCRFRDQRRLLRQHWPLTLGLRRHGFAVDPDPG
jgi:CysZ protein